jgi:hypothetical protein
MNAKNKCFDDCNDSQGINRPCWVYVVRGDAGVILNGVNVTFGNVLKGNKCSQVVLIAEGAAT